MPDTPVVAVENLQKTYKSGLFRRRQVRALKGVSFDVGPGTVFGLLGPNGAGKTTLIKILLGIIRRTGGEAAVLGQSAGNRQARRRVGYLPEHHRIPRHLTGYTALEFYGQLSDLPLSEIRRKRDPLLDQVGLAGWGKASVREYSKGMLQRLGLAQAMLHDPDLLILDEPTDGVDPVGRAEIRETLFALKAQGRAVFLNSHLLQEIELVCDQVAILKQGNILHVGPVEHLTEAAASDIVLHLGGDEPAIRAALDGAQIISLEPATGGRPTAVRLHSSSQADVDGTIDALRAAGISIHALFRNRLTLEQAFLRLVEETKIDS